jgi:hypothetical protein
MRIARGINTTTYTYGQPRTGNVAYAKYVDEKMGGMYRVTYKDDGICQIPPPTQGYRHHTTEYWVTDPPSPANTKKCEGQEDKVRSKFTSYEQATDKDVIVM